MPDALRFAFFLLVFGAVAGLVHRYLYVRLCRDLSEAPRWRRVGKFAFTFLAVFVAAAAPLGFLLPEWADPLLAWPAFLWIGALGPLLSSLLLLEPLRFFFARARPPAEAGSPLDAAALRVDADRRRLLGRALTGAAAGASFGLASYGVFRAYAAPEITELSVKLPGLPKSLDGLRLYRSPTSTSETSSSSGSWTSSSAASTSSGRTSSRSPET